MNRKLNEKLKKIYSNLTATYIYGEFLISFRFLFRIRTF